MTMVAGQTSRLETPGETLEKTLMSALSVGIYRGMGQRCRSAFLSTQGLRVTLPH